MASLNVGTATAVQVPVVGRMRPVIQNLGPGNIYMGPAGVTTESGLMIVPNSAYEVPSFAGVGFWVIADADDTDVRYLTLGS